MDTIQDSLSQDQNIENQLQSLKRQNQKMKMILVLLLTILLGVAGALAFLLLKTQVKSNPQTPISQNTNPTPKTNTAQTEISVPNNWKTYENTKFNYELKYPDNWIGSTFVADSDGSLLADSSTVIFKINNLNNDYYNNTMYIDQCISDSDENGLYTVDPINPSRKEELINGIVMKQLSGINGNGLNHIAYIIKTPNNHCLRITFTYDKESLENKNIFDQILSTFKFINTYRSYKNETLKYSVNIPENWIIDTKNDLEGIFTVDSSYPGTRVHIFKDIKKTPLFDTNFQFWYEKPANKNSQDNIYKYDSITVDDNNAVQIYVKSENDEPIDQLITWVSHNEDNYFISIYGSPDLIKRYLGDYNNLILTFKFAE